MQVSLAGFVVCAGLLLIGYYLRATLIVALMGSLAFGSTAIATFTTLGGSSPLASTFFAFVLLLFVFARRRTLRELVFVFSEHRAAWVASGLMLYACLSAVLLPRMFAGRTSAFVASRAFGQVLEVPLSPVAGNVTQTCYFVTNVLTFLALSILFLRPANLQKIRLGFFAWCIVHTALGLIDFIGKLSGAGDLLEPMRSAAYALATNVDMVGFPRIAGGYSEASAFGASTLAAFAFAFTYWRKTQSAPALALSIVLLFLLILCTSTTAYVGAVIISIPLIFGLGRSILGGRYSRNDLVLFAVALLAVMMALSIYLYDEGTVAPFVRLFEITILDKSLSASAQERTIWNHTSLQSFLDTGGLGVGFGSSRASSWIIAVISQIGILGTLLMAGLVMEFLRDVGWQRCSQVHSEMRALHDGARACALAWLIAASIAGATADPGLLFFAALATTLACRTQYKSSCVRAADQASNRS